MTKKIQLNFAIFVLAFIILGSILAPLLATHNPFEPDMANRLQSPCWQHFFGTDALGRDMFSRADSRRGRWSVVRFLRR